MSDIERHKNSGGIMKKVLIGVLVVLVAVVVAAPYVNGYLMEKILVSQVEKYNQEYSAQALGMKLEISRYDRGFGTSEIEWRVLLPEMAPFNTLEPIVLTESAKHGYLVVTSQTSLEQNSWYADFVREKLNGKNPLKISNTYSLLGTITSTVLVDKFEVTDGTDTLVVSPGELIIQVTPSSQTFASSGSFEGFSVPGELKIAGINLSYDGKRISSMIMDGESTVTIKEAEINADGQQVKCANLQGQSFVDFDKDTNTLSLSTRYSVDQLVTAEKTIDDLRVTIGLNHLDAEGFENFQKVYLNTVMDVMKSMPQAEKDPEQFQAMMDQKMALAGMQMMTEVEKLLKKDLQFEISGLHLKLPEGEIDGDFQIGLKKDMSLAGFIGLAQQLSEVTNVFSLQSSCSLPDGLVNEQEKLLVPMLPGMQSGLFQQDGERLVHSAEIKDNKLYLNGNEFPLNF